MLFLIYFLVGVVSSRSDNVLGYFKPEHYHLDHDSYIERPCNLHDLNCIRSFFAYNYGCSPKYGPAPDSYTIQSKPLNVPNANVSAVLNDIELKGLNSGKILEFYFNKKIDTLVFEVEFEDLSSYSAHTVITYHRKGKEPIEGSDFSVAEFKRLSLTLTIRHVKNQLLPERHVYAYLSDPKLLVKVGPGLLATNIKGLEATNMKWLEDMNSTIMDVLASEGSVYMEAFIKTRICDFTYNII